MSESELQQKRMRETPDLAAPGAPPPERAVYDETAAQEAARLGLDESEVAEHRAGLLEAARQRAAETAWMRDAGLGKHAELIVAARVEGRCNPLDAHDLVELGVWDPDYVARFVRAALELRVSVNARPIEAALEPAFEDRGLVPEYARRLALRGCAAADFVRECTVTAGRCCGERRLRLGEVLASVGMTEAEQTAVARLAEGYEPGRVRAEALGVPPDRAAAAAARAVLCGGRRDPLQFLDEADREAVEARFALKRAAAAAAAALGLDAPGRERARERVAAAVEAGVLPAEPRSAADVAVLRLAVVGADGEFDAETFAEVLRVVRGGAFADYVRSGFDLGYGVPFDFPVPPEWGCLPRDRLGPDPRARDQRGRLFTLETLPDPATAAVPPQPTADTLSPP